MSPSTTKIPPTAKIARTLAAPNATIGSVTDIERYQYGYNLASLKQWRRNVVAESQNAGQDEYYRYDGLHQVVDRQLGTLNTNRTAISGVPSGEEQWGYDAAGNWEQYIKLANGQVADEIESSFNKVNEYRTYRDQGGSEAARRRRSFRAH